MSDLNELFKQASNEQLSKLDSIIELGMHLSTESSGIAFIDTAKSKFYDYVGRVQTFIKSLSLISRNNPHLDATAMLERYGARDYSENRTLTFEVAPGFNGNLPEFLHLLQDDILPAAEASEASLKVVVTRLAVLLNEPDRLKAQSGIRDMEQHLRLVDVKTLEKVKSFFKTGAKSQLSVKDVMDRNADMPMVYQMTNAITTRLEKIDFKKTQALVQRLGELTGSLNKQLNEGAEGGREEVAGAVAGQLSDLFYRIGVMLTSCSVLLELNKQHYDAMSRNIDGLLDQIPEPLDKELSNIGNQSVRLRSLSAKFPNEFKHLIKRMDEMRDFIFHNHAPEQGKAAEEIYDKLCEETYLANVHDDKAALAKFTADVTKAEHEIKALGA